MRESWTDDRLDYLNRKVEDGFKQMDERFGHLEKRVDERFDDVNRRLKETDRRLDEGFGQVDERLARMESRADHLSESFLDLGKSINFSTRALIATLVIGFLTVVVTKL